MFQKLCLIGGVLLVAAAAFGGASWLATVDEIPLGGQVMFDAGIAFVAGLFVYALVDANWPK